MAYVLIKFAEVFIEQMRGMFTSAHFNEAHLPLEAKHWFSGLSGFMFILPIFSRNRMTRYGKGMWLMQALLSVLADYTYLGLSHPVHGVDRHAATINCIRLFMLGINAGLWYYIRAASVPLGIHLAARIAKKEENWPLWIFLHGWWHISGPILIYWLYNDEEKVYVAKQKKLYHAGTRVDGKYARKTRSMSRKSLRKKHPPSTPNA
eukprot:CAMPEP_0118653916 /NCGR_PEP_ID=MMETSP0785-20121206/12087_1 /TAXON_ID=91992 /ORGANISM="Bolidomonas pacifica, Strain CCMP 1866" /LENGTH=205 /DNA_ID=CAMNT_0006546493 /DNA_START=128 /DNA_END=742 /DNA_ORIENTATION=-